MNSSPSSSVLFLGAPGLIGNHVIPALVKAGIPVLAASRRGRAVGGGAGVTVDMQDRQALTRTMQGIAAVAFVIPDVIDMEALGLNVVAAAQSAGVKQLLWFSSFGADPKNEALFSRRHPTIDEAVRASGIPYAILRPNFFMQDFTAFYGQTSGKRARFSSRWGTPGSVISICAISPTRPSRHCGTIGFSAKLTI
jgi:uncharacterized protein YbjT (DUF2867 family)